MRHQSRRILFGTAALLVGILIVNRTPSEAADPEPDAEFKAMFDRDLKNLKDQIAVGAKGGKANIARGSRATKSHAMMIAFLANSRITGKNAMDDAKLATLRDKAIEVAVAAGKKKFDVAGAAAGALAPNMPAAAKVNAAKMTTAQLVAAGDMDVEELMYQQKKTLVGGLELEDQVKAVAGGKANLKPAEAEELIARLLIITEYCDVMTPQKGFAGANNKARWLALNKATKDAAKEALTAATAKKPDPKAVKTAFTNLDGSCVACHNVFK